MKKKIGKNKMLKACKFLFTPLTQKKKKKASSIWPVFFFFFFFGWGIDIYTDPKKYKLKRLQHIGSLEVILD